MILRKQAVLDHFSGKYAVLLLENNQEVHILKDELDGRAAVGDQYVWQLLPVQEAALTQEELARTLLNQILRNDRQKEQSD